MKVRCLVLDDDPVFCAITAKLVEEHPKLELIEKFNDPEEAKTFLYNNKVQLLFADMEMPGLTGIDFIKSLPEPPETIFITAYRDYAVESYALQATDYLIKPVEPVRFNSAVEKAIRSIKANSQAIKQKESFGLHFQDDHFFIRSDSQYVRVKFSEIYYVEALKDFVKIHTHAKTHIALVNLKSIEAALPEEMFLRTHRSYLVNREHILAVDGETIETAASSIPLGNSYKEAVLNELLGNRLIKRR